MARLEGFEPPTNGFGSHYSIRLSYRRVVLSRVRCGECGASVFVAGCEVPGGPAGRSAAMMPWVAGAARRVRRPAILPRIGRQRVMCVMQADGCAWWCEQTRCEGQGACQLGNENCYH